MPDDTLDSGMDLSQLIVLVVDDEPLIRGVFLHALQEKQYSVVTQECPQFALDFLVNADVAVVVSDNHMPGMLGKDFLRYVSRHYPEASRVFMSGLATKAECPEADYFLAKPFREGDLHEMLDSAIELHLNRVRQYSKRDQS